jgi:hypothetical protein
MAHKIQIHGYIHGSCLRHIVIVWLDSIWWESVDQIIYKHLDSKAYKKLPMLIQRDQISLAI